MEFGVFQAASVGPRPWDESEPRRFRQDIEIGVAADRAGFDMLVFVPGVGWGNTLNEVCLESVAYAGEHVLPQFRKGGGPRA
ncbi:MAG: LLM class flavin-dependent oxidoreductase [Myxococcota bacterium]|nr:LLM class flavin-dependent oxidoreductase [Myxococcota bacterium]